MRKTLIAFLVVAFVIFSKSVATAQQVPFLSEFFSRYEDFNRAYSEKRRSGANAATIEGFRKRIEEAFKRGSIPEMIEVIGEAQALAAGKKWDERQRFIASLTIEPDRLVIEPNQILELSLTRMFPVNIEKAFATAPTVSFVIVPVEAAAKTGESSSPPVTQPVVIAERLAIAEKFSNAARKLLLPEGSYSVVARVESGGQLVAEIRRPIYAISDFSGSIRQMSRTIANIKGSTDPKVKALLPLLATAEFQHQRLAQLNKSRGEGDLNPNKEMDRIEAELSALAKGQNPFGSERGEIERAYQASDGKFFPYRLYVPRSYDGSSAKPLVVMLHGPLGDERYYFSGLFDPGVIKGEAERRGYLFVGVNSRSRFGVSEEDVFEVIAAVTRDYKIDSSRIYLTGHSIGGFAAWLVASRKPELFAAIAAVAGGAPEQGDALNAVLANLKDTPAMIVHGAHDGIASVQLSRTMASAAEKAGLRVTYIEVPDGDHLTVAASTFPAVLDFFDKQAKQVK